MGQETVGTAVATGQESGQPVEQSAFSRSVSSLLARTEYRRCVTGEDLEAIYRLRYKAFRNHGSVVDDPSQRTSDALDDAPNSYRFGVFVDGALVSTVRLHHISKDEPYGPVMKVFSDVLEPRLAQGEIYVNPSQFTADPDVTSSYRLLPYLTLRLAVIANTYFDSTSCVCLIRNDHAGFYKRIFGSVQVGLPRPYPPFTVPVMLYESNCAINMGKTLERYPFFHSSETERRLLFAPHEADELAPLTVLPTPGKRAAA